MLGPLVESYGVSRAEAPVRETVKRLLPAGAPTQTDTAGNLWLTLGSGEPTVVFVAHLDEIGFRVTTVRDDGTLDADAVGRSLPVALGGPARAGPHRSRRRARSVRPQRLDAARSRARHAALGPRRRRHRPIARAPRRSASAPARRSPAPSASSGCWARARPAARSTTASGSTALVIAARRLLQTRLRHTVILIWSVREEIGLEGAQAAAAALGLRPARVHAIDTFVSADSPLERRNFAVAPLGRGPVARALDNSSVTPPAYVDSLTALARARAIPLQVGTTNGGNDGSVFSDWGVPDVPIGWPLRYAHSPAEVIDLRDVAGLADIVTAAASAW